MQERKIHWDEQAIKYFSKSIAYIRKDSPQNAEKIRDELIKQVNALAQKPEIYPPDKYKTNNAGNYRVFELYRFRVSYLVQEGAILITRIRHTKQEPKEY